jgi:hypothetical protein
MLQRLRPTRKRPRLDDNVSRHGVTKWSRGKVGQTTRRGSGDRKRRRAGRHACPPANFRQRLGWSVKIVANVAAAVEALSESSYDFIFIDRDLAMPAHGFGEDLVVHLTRISFTGKVIGHSANPAGAEFVKHAFPEAEIIPFTLLGLIRVPK